jgi:hypothetical protein
VTDLYVSLSGDVANETAEAFADALDARGVPLTHLLRPAAAPADLVAWVRERCSRGDTLALHGFDHAPRPLGHGRRKGEFASLPRHEAGLRLTAARRALTAAALWTDVFVPPRWLASDARSPHSPTRASACSSTNPGSATCPPAPSCPAGCSASGWGSGCSGRRSPGRYGAADRCGSTSGPRTCAIPAGWRRRSRR